MTNPEFIAEYHWTSDAVPLCTINVPVEGLATRLGLPVVRWVEPGLGEAIGFGCRLKSGDVVLLEELSHAKENLAFLGATVYMEASRLAELGMDNSLSVVLQGLDLMHHNVTWRTMAPNLW